MQIAIFYVDLGNRLYREMAEACFDSARRAMPDAELLLMTDADTEPMRQVDRVMAAKTKCPADRVVGFKGRMMALHGIDTDGPVVFSDADVIFNRPIAGEMDGEWDIGIMYREGMPSQPYNDGIVYSKSTAGAKEFWRRYVRLLADLPDAMQHWWASQYAFALACGVDGRPGDILQIGPSKVAVFDMGLHAPAPGVKPQGVTDSFCVHFKGNRKGWMLDYARAA